jgi:hypothetical protein
MRGLCLASNVAQILTRGLSPQHFSGPAPFPMMKPSDCSGCVGLCCVALAFDRSEHFAFDKPAGVRCSHLGEDNRCRIHHERAARGFGGCIRYDCGGAGPRALATLGRSRVEADSAALASAFAIERDVNEARALLETARKLPLSEHDETHRAVLASRLEAATWPELAGPIFAFLRALRRS